MKTHILRALSEKSFFNLWIGEVFTQISVNLFNFFLILIAFKLTHSNTAVSGIVISFTIPAIIFGSLAGVLVDRWKKKRVLIVANLARAILLIVLIFYVNNIYMLFAISFLFSILTQFFIPAETPMIPLVVQKKHLLSANALFGMGIYGSILIAYILVGPMLIFLKPVNTLLVLAIMLFIGAVFISFIKAKPTVAPKIINLKELNILKDIQHTLHFVSQSKSTYHSLFLLALSQIIILVVATIAPGYAESVLGLSVEEFPLLFVAPAAVGMIIGAVILVNVFHSHPRQKIINFGIFLSGVAMFLLPYGSKVASRDFVQALNTYLPHYLDINIFHIMVVLAFILGLANSLVFVPANTILQEKTSDEFRGKIYGLLNSVVGVLSLLPIIIVGGLSDIIGVGAVLYGIGISLVLLSMVRRFF